ncbi:hypothetical protein [Fodinibius saliphilus]|uniref:hypothetical protein n=1 Tax=Fodinibius saliphilus TaxID=1920650 RepID=UPI0011083E01|nr:hypothetical protein [Fodinibius saliphilus]
MKQCNTWTAFSKFISGLDIPEAIKEQEGNKKLQVDHQFYLDLFSMLSPAFPNVDQVVVERLSLAGYLYFRTTLLLDQQFDTVSDNTNTSSIKRMMLCMAYHERSIKELTQVFESNHPFWEEFDVIKKRYLEANMLEKKLSKEQQFFTEKLFEQLAEGKSGLSIASVLALCSVNNNFDTEKYWNARCCLFIPASSFLTILMILSRI